MRPPREAGTGHRGVRQRPWEAGPAALPGRRRTRTGQGRGQDKDEEQRQPRGCGPAGEGDERGAGRGGPAKAQERPLLVAQTGRIAFIFLPFQYILDRPKSKSILTRTRPHRQRPWGQGTRQGHAGGPCGAEGVAPAEAPPHELRGAAPGVRPVAVPTSPGGARARRRPRPDGPGLLKACVLTSRHASALRLR